MIALATRLITATGRRAALWGALGVIVMSALCIAARQGRRKAQATFAARSAEARIRALRTSHEVTHDIENLPDDERDRRLDRWMRD